MMRSTAKPRKPIGAAKAKPGSKGQPTLEDFVTARDYTGALALLDFKLKTADGDVKDLQMWIGYCAFHLGNFRRAEEAYKSLIQEHDVKGIVHLYLACCYFFQQMFEEAEAAAEKGPSDPLKNRLLFNIAHRMGDENKLMKYHQTLRDTKDDQLSLAAVHYLRSHYQEVMNYSICLIYTHHFILILLWLTSHNTSQATDIYKRQLLENREDLALNVYVAMCYYKLDYYDVSLEILAVYLQVRRNKYYHLNMHFFIS